MNAASSSQSRKRCARIRKQICRVKISINKPAVSSATRTVKILKVSAPILKRQLEWRDQLDAEPVIDAVTVGRHPITKPKS